jgi:hypothetical protein
MPKSSRVARQRAEQAAAALRRDQQRQRRVRWAVGASVAVVAVLAVLVVVRVSMGSRSEPAPPSSAAAGTVLAAVTAVPPATLDRVGKGTVDSVPKAITGQPALTKDGKPLVVYIGAEYCPFCATQRWGMIVALSRFGTFSGLTTTRSASDDVFPNTATFSFHGSTYTSDHLSFEGVELQTATRATLDTPTAQQEQILRTYNAPPFVAAESAGAIPFIDFANQFIISGAAVSPQLLAGLTADQVAARLADPADPLTTAIYGSANAFTAVLCQLTKGQPGSVCETAAVKAYQGTFGG